MIDIIKSAEFESFFLKLEKRRFNAAGNVSSAVRTILSHVQKRGDSAVCGLTLKFDGAAIDPYSLMVQAEEIRRAAASMPNSFLEILRQSARNIRAFHEKQMEKSWISWEENGVMLGQKVTALDSVAVYAPGGSAAYPSSLLMGVIPAQTAGVRKIAVFSPPDKNGKVSAPVLAAASVLGINTVYRIGGAQAIGAAAFGTESIPKADKIVGPGNQYVTEAKRQVFGMTGIDMVAGPSEVAIWADRQADARIIAADLLAQAEHDPFASSVLITDSEKLASDVYGEICLQIKPLKRREIIEKSLSDWSAVLLTENQAQCAETVNRLAPEHLGLHVKKPWDKMKQIRHAGAIFLGEWTPETVGDYWAGPNHVLPTCQSARFSSPLGVYDFIKRSSIIEYSRDAFHKDAQSIIQFAETEGLDGHANAVRQRLA